MSFANDRNEDASQYEYIIKKLQKTVATYQAVFPDLALLKVELEKFAILHDGALPNLEKLEAICDLLKQHTVESYTIRHLYHNLCRDVDFYRQGTLISDINELYIETPHS